MTKYDAIIIGSGQAANPLASKLAAAGWKTALIEKKFIGGTCLNTGCTPTKTLIASGRMAWLARRSAVYGIHTGEVSVDIESVIRRKNAKVLAARESSSKRLLETKQIDVHFGTAFFSGPKEVTLLRDDGSNGTMTADHLFINTGTRPVIPSIPGLDSIPFLTSDTILDLLVIPKQLTIIGGSYIALEFGQLYRRLGSEVTILESNTRFLAKEDEDIADELKNILEEDGIRIFTGATVEKVRADGAANRADADDASIHVDVAFSSPVAIASGSEVAEVRSRNAFTCSHVLVATGRLPDTAALNPAAAGIELDPHGFIKVNQRLETTAPGIYALGDVKGGPQFTHISYNDHLIVYKNLVEKADCSIAGRPLVYCLFTDPELGRIGLTENEAREKGLNFQVAKLPAAKIARAWENDETRGLLKAIVDVQTKTILGAAMLSPAGGELMTVLQMAMKGNITYEVLRDMVFAHPTLAESLNNLFARLTG
jgi:pyruvate/2-oxoglutarate dehydrogenase complex dihydrolipoamide dehydrogenase (E3) component